MACASCRLLLVNISRDRIVKLDGFGSLEIIEAYPDNKYLPSFLLRGETKGAVFRAQIATDVEGIISGL